MIDPSFLLVGVIGLLSDRFRADSHAGEAGTTHLVPEIDLAILILAYFAGMALLYIRE